MRWLRYLYRVPLLLIHLFLFLPLTLFCMVPVLAGIRVDGERLEHFAVRTWSAGLMRVFGFRPRRVGRPFPGPALFVANHVSWIDIEALHSQRMMGFVAKHEIRTWPVVGWLAARGETIFHHRGSQESLGGVLHEMLKRLRSGRSVGVFPEGRTRDGHAVGPFHARIFLAAVEAGVPVQPVALRYGELKDDSEQSVKRASDVRKAFNSPFWPFVLVSTSVGQEGIDFAYRLNRLLVEGPMASYPGRFQAFATLPLQSPEAAADELERSVKEDGFLGALTNGHITKKYLDHPDFEPVLARAVALDVPIYLHPGYPADEVFKIYYSTTRSEYTEEFQDYIFSGSGYGWHQEVLTQCVRMIAYGVFDRFPKLKIIIGHMGEGLPFYYKRILEDMGEATESSLEKPFEQYFQDNFWVTTSAFPQTELLDLLLKYISVDRVMFATDYPFADIKEQTDWFRGVDLPREDKEKIAFRNAEKLFRMKVPVK